MKKTLITLAALAMASVASAVSDGIPAVDIYNPDKENYQYADSCASYTWVLTMKWADVETSIDKYDGMSYFYMGNGRDKWAALGVAFFEDGSDSNLFHIKVAQWKDSTLASSMYTDNDGFTLSVDKNTFLITKENYGYQDTLTLSYSYDASTKVYTLGALKTDGSLATAKIDKSNVEGGWNPGSYAGADLVNASAVDHFVMYEGALSGNSLKYAMQTSIPEPATATLSLLALAGLAARRRRK